MFRERVAQRPGRRVSGGMANALPRVAHVLGVQSTHGTRPWTSFCASNFRRSCPCSHAGWAAHPIFGSPSSAAGVPVATMLLVRLVVVAAVAGTACAATGLEWVVVTSGLLFFSTSTCHVFHTAEFSALSPALVSAAWMACPRCEHSSRSSLYLVSLTLRLTISILILISRPAGIIILFKVAGKTI